MIEQLSQQLETVQAIIVALATSFIGTSTVALIIRGAINRVVKRITEKVEIAEQKNLITSETSTKAIAIMESTQAKLTEDIKELQNILEHFAQSQNTNSQSVDALITEFKERDARIKEFLEEEIGEEFD